MAHLWPMTGRVFSYHTSLDSKVLGKCAQLAQSHISAFEFITNSPASSVTAEQCLNSLNSLPAATTVPKSITLAGQISTVA